MRLTPQHTTEQPNRPTERFISSLIIHARPEQIQYVRQHLDASADDLEVSYVDEHIGKFVVVLETATMAEIEQFLERAREIRGVLTVAMVYFHAEQENLLNEPML